MKRLLLLAAAAAPLLAAAQSARVDAAAPSAILPYQSAFAGYLPAPQSDVTPDKAWLLANSELAAAGGQAGHGMMSMHQDKAVPQQTQQAHQGHSAPQAAPTAAAPHQGHQAAPSPARPTSAPQPQHGAPASSPASDPHQGHHMQMKGQ